MQLKPSLLAFTLLLAAHAQADDYVAVHYIHYDEGSGRTTIQTPTVEINKDFGTDYTLNLSAGRDALSGASPTWYDATSGASARLPDHAVPANDIHYGNIAYDDNRTFVSGALTTRFENRDALTVGLNYSSESDYLSRGVSAEYLHYLDEGKNRSVSVGLSYQKNSVDVHCFLGNTICDAISGASSKTITKDLDVINAEIGLTQILDTQSLIKASLFYNYESGYLSNPYMRVVRNKTHLVEEAKPDTRKGGGATLTYSRALTDDLSANLYYRFYHDDWGITSHTISLSTFYTLNDTLTLGLAGRYYTQSAAWFYHPGKAHFTDETYASSDRRMGAWHAYDVKVSADIHVSEAITIQSAAGYYTQPGNFHSRYLSVGMKYGF